MNKRKVKDLKVLLSALDDVNEIVENGIRRVFFQLNHPHAADVYITDSTIIDEFRQSVTRYKERIETKLKEVLKDE
jgi:hypothetical protein